MSSDLVTLNPKGQAYVGGPLELQAHEQLRNECVSTSLWGER